MSEGPDDDGELAMLLEQAALPVGRDATVAAAELFVQHFRLAFPPVPVEAMDSLRMLGPALFGTRADADPWDFEARLRELRTPPVADYLLFGQSGHGVAGTAMHYCRVQPGLALFVQILWGTAYSDDAVAADEISLAFDRCAELITAPAAGRIAAGHRLVAVHSDLHGQRLGWLDGQGHGDLDPCPRPLDEALAMLGASAR